MSLRPLVLSLIVGVATLLPKISVVFAAPVTGYGPGGYEDDNGADNLVLWLDAGKGVFTHDGGTGVGPAANPTDPVRQWRDQSGYNNHANQSTQAAQATLQSSVLNGQRAIRFSSSVTGDTYSTSLTQPAIVTTFVAYANRTGDTGTLYSSTAAHDQIQRDTAYWFDSSVGNLTVAGDTTNNSRLVTMRYDYNADNYTVYLDGTLRGTATNAGQPSTGVVILGARAGTSEFLDGDMLEMVIVNRIVNSVERTVTENYLASKYNTDSIATFAIGNDHYTGDTLTKGNFDFGVFGIGDDGTSELDSAGSEGMGIEVANGSLSSGQWVLAGHDSGSNGVTSNDMLATTQRWERSWFVDTTGVASADLAFDWNDAGVTAPFNSAFVGLYFRANNSGLFSLVTVGTLDSINQRVDFSGISLPVGDGYFTLGSLPVPEPSTGVLLGVGLAGLVWRRRRVRPAN